MCKSRSMASTSQVHTPPAPDRSGVGFVAAWPRITARSRQQHGHNNRRGDGRRVPAHLLLAPLAPEPHRRQPRPHRRRAPAAISERRDRISRYAASGCRQRGADRHDGVPALAGEYLGGFRSVVGSSIGEFGRRFADLFAGGVRLVELRHVSRATRPRARHVPSTCQPRRRADIQCHVDGGDVL